MRISSFLKSKRGILIFGAIAIIVLGLLTLSTIGVNQIIRNIRLGNKQELAVSQNYEQVKEGDNSTQSEYVKFDAYVLKDLDGDGNAEKLRGTCKKIGSQDTLYMELNVNSVGYLKDGKITINGKNFYLSTALVSDNIINGNYISKNTTKISLNKLNEGTNTLIQGTIKSGDYTYTSTKASAIQSGDINNYSVNDNKIVFTGTYVDENGEETQIEKEVNLTVDWYGEIEANIKNAEQNYELDYTNSALTFNIEVEETKKELMLSKLYVEGNIPQLNGYDPISVNVQDGEYDSNTRKFIIEKASNISESGLITEQIQKSYTFQISVEYPEEAFGNVEAGTSLIITIPVKAYYEGYNNKKVYESGILKSEEVSKDINITYVELKTDREYLYGTIINKELSKRNVLDVYDGVENVINDRFEVQWQVVRTEETNSGNIILKQDRLDQLDNFATDSIKNIGIYFSGNINKLLGENGIIKLYDNETNELIKEFNKDNWNQTYYYETDVKYIRIETSEVVSAEGSELGTIKVNNIKEIDSVKLANQLERDELLSYEKIYSYSTCITGDSLTVLAKTNYKSPTSDLELSTDIQDVSSQIKNGITLTINATNPLEDSWKDGKFIVKLPKEITNIDINNIRTNNSQVTIEKYYKYKENGITYIVIDTGNDNPVNFNIIINMGIECDPIMQNTLATIETYASNPENEIYSLSNRNLDIFDVNNNGVTNDYVAYSKTSINIIAPNNLLTTENIVDENGNILARPSENLEIDKTALGEKETIEIKILNNYSGESIKDTVIVGKVAFKDNTYVISGSNVGSDYSVSMTDEGILIPDELKDKVKVYYSEKDNITKDLNDTNNSWTQTPTDFTKVKSYLIDLSELTLTIGESYTFKYDINLPSDVSYNESSYSTHAVYFNLITNEGKLQQNIETNRLGILVAKKYNLQLTDYEELTTEPIKGISYSISGSDDEIILTTDENGTISVDGLYVEKEYEIVKTKVPSTYELDDTVRKFKLYEDKETLKIENIEGNFKTQEVNKETSVVKLSLENKAKYILDLTKLEQGTSNGIENVKFLLKGKGSAKNGTILQTNSQGKVLISGLYQDEIYTLQETYAKGYKENTQEINFKVTIENEKYKLEVLNGNCASASIIKEFGTRPILSLVLENEKEDSYTFNLTKLQKNNSTTVAGAKFNIKGKWIADEGEEYTTDSYGEIELTLYEGFEYTLKEIQPPEGYVLNDQEIKFIATKDAEGKLTLNVTQGTFAESTNIVNNTVYVKVENEKLFTITKQDEETGELLKGVKFAIYKVNRNEDGTETLAEAKNLEGEAIGQEETINGVSYRVLETDDNGQISELLEVGLYKAIEVQALEGYYLGSIEEHTYYFGIDASEKGKSTITVKAEYPNILATSMIETNDGGYVGVYCNTVTKYNSNFEEEWKTTSSYGNAQHIAGTIYNQIIQTNDGGYVATMSSNGMSQSYISKYSSSGTTEWEKELDVSGKVGSIILAKDNTLMVAVTTDTNNSNNLEAIQSTNYHPISILKYSLSGELVWEKEYNIGMNYIFYGARIIEDNNGSFVIATRGYGAHLIKFNKEGDLLWTRAFTKASTSTTSDYTGFEDICITEDSGYVLVGSSEEMSEYGIYGVNNRGELATTGLIAKYSKLGELEWVKENSNERILYSILKLKDGTYLVEGRKSVYKYSSDFELETTYTFENKIVNNHCYESDENGEYRFSSYNFKLLNNGDILIPSDGYSGESSINMIPTSILEINTESSTIPEKQEIIVYNKLKEYAITTFAGENGTISGVDDTVYETVQHGKDATKEIVVTPDEGYRVLAISVNGEKISFEEKESNIVKLPLFTNVTQNKQVLATFIEESKMGEVNVKYYKTGTMQEVATSEIIRGVVDEKYSTNPKDNIVGYMLNVDKLPTNATGVISKEATEVIYYYDEEPIKIITHYINSETNEKLQEDTVQYKIAGEEYTTQGLEQIPEGFELVSEPTNKNGTVKESEENREIEITYYYRLKQFAIKTEVKGSGGIITGQGKDAFEIVKYGNNSVKDIIATPDNGYEVSSIKINGNNLSYNKNQDGTVTLEKLTEVKENKTITVEFQKIKAKVIIKYLDSKTTEEIQNSEEKTGEVGEEYIAIEKEIEGYRLTEPIPENAKGIFTQEVITVEYYYEKENTTDEGDNDKGNDDTTDEPIIIEQETEQKTEAKQYSNPVTGDNIYYVIAIIIIICVINAIITIKRREMNND